MRDLKFITKALHTKYPKDDIHGALRMPVYDSAAFEYQTAEDIEAAFNGSMPGHVYSRSTNPTVEYFEKVLMNLTNSFGVISFSSGMAAISNLMIAIASSGDNIITTKYLFGNTYSLFNKSLKQLGISTKFLDLTNIELIEKSIDANTKAIFLETITNPQLEVADLKAISDITKRHNILLIVDSTVTPPCVFNSKEFGVNIEVVSSTKYISGGGTAIGGAVIDNGNFDWSKISKLQPIVSKFGKSALLAKLRKEIHRNFGSCLSPHNAYLHTLGLETLSLRVDRSCQNTLALATWLQTLPLVKSVNYPGLLDSKYYKVAKSQFLYPSSILTIDLESKEKCYVFMNRLNLVRRATNLSDNKTLIIHPESTIYVEYDSNTVKSMAIRDTLLRISVGIEDIDDLKQDIINALEV